MSTVASAKRLQDSEEGRGGPSTGRSEQPARSKSPRTALVTLRANIEAVPELKELMDVDAPPGDLADDESLGSWSQVGSTAIVPATGGPKVPMQVEKLRGPRGFRVEGPPGTYLVLDEHTQCHGFCGTCMNLASHTLAVALLHRAECQQQPPECRAFFCARCLVATVDAVIATQQRSDGLPVVAFLIGEDGRSLRQADVDELQALVKPFKGLTELWRDAAPHLSTAGFSDLRKA